MKFDLEIPEFLSHLPKDERGYPIPYFVGIRDGKPDFRLLDQQKQQICIEYKKCAICGRKLLKHLYYFISGPLGAKNKVSSDPAMHKECARFSLRACPHLFYEKATRRDKDIIDDENVFKHPANVLLEKPAAIFMVQARDFYYDKTDQVIRYKPEKLYQFVYQDGILHEVTFPPFYHPATQHEHRAINK